EALLPSHLLEEAELAQLTVLPGGPAVQQQRQHHEQQHPPVPRELDQQQCVTCVEARAGSHG
ncbi:hypothetical protein, partial [Providencia stuartii]|uniref:hypothetical protein n=1 Tax=Providencia stuartii TaxID=588 RepID=UPI0013D5913B